MKAKLFLLLIFFLLTIFGCEKEDVLEFPKPVIELFTVSPETVNINSRAVITWKFSGKYGELNGLRVENNDSTQTAILAQDRTYTLVVYNEVGEKVSESKTVVVYTTPEQPIPAPTLKDTMTYLVCLETFKPFKHMAYLYDGRLVDAGFSEAEAKQVWKFTANGRLEDITSGNQGNWYFTNNLKSIYHWGVIDSIISLTDKELILGYYETIWDPSINQPVKGPKLGGMITYVH